MAKEKRIVVHPWGRKKRGGWIIQPPELLSALKQGQVAEFGNLHVGAEQLRKILALMQFPDEEILITTNGQLEVENIKRVIVTRNGKRRTNFRKPKLQHSFRVGDGAWVTKSNRPRVTLVIKPRKYA